MQTLGEYIRNGSPCSYDGNKESWLVVLTVHRDASLLESTNFECAHGMLHEIESGGCYVERFSHFAFGWIDHLLVNPESAESVKKAEKILSSLASYGSLDDEAYSRAQILRAQELIDEIEAHYEPEERLDAYAAYGIRVDGVQAERELLDRILESEYCN